MLIQWAEKSMEVKKKQCKWGAVIRHSAVGHVIQKSDLVTCCVVVCLVKMGDGC